MNTNGMRDEEISVLYRTVPSQNVGCNSTGPNLLLEAIYAAWDIT